jgi:predicted DNA-binding protein (MmcQ/YjbR family)
MLNFEEIKRLCLEKPGAYECCPFGPLPICYKVGSRIFLEWYPEDEKLTLRCEPMLGDYYKEHYPEIVLPGYHCPERQRRYKITVYLNKGLEDGIIAELIDHSYQEAVRRISRSEREILEKNV